MNTAILINLVLPRNAVEYLLLVKELYLVKSEYGRFRVVLKAKDVCRVYGLCNMKERTSVGKVMGWLVREGFLQRVANGKYRPTRKFIEWALQCRYPECETNASLCGLVGLCPVHRLKEIMKEVKTK